MLQLTIHACPSPEVDHITEQLESWGAVSVTWLDETDSPIYEPGVGEVPLWPLVTIQALFDETPDEQTLAQLLADTFMGKTYALNPLPEQDWIAINQASFQPFAFGKNCWICPTWATPVEPDALNVILDPGLAFGTGMHPTTFLCLQWLSEANLSGQSVIDYGSGSGVLGIAALLLGAETVQAVDNDPQAHIATLDNAKRNHIPEHKLSVHPPEDTLLPADIIVANILLRPLIALTQSFYDVLKPNGLLVVSGLFEGQGELLIEAYHPYFKNLKMQDKDGWNLLIFQRQQDVRTDLCKALT